MPAHPLSEAQARETLALVEKHGGNIAAAARAIGAPVETLRSRFRRAQQVVGIGTPPIPPPTPVERQEIQRLKDRVARLQAELADAHRSSIAADDVRREIFRLAETPTPPKWAITPKLHTKTPGMPVLFLSDLHAGEVVDGRVMHGANAYNLDIAERRLRQICTRAADLCLNHMVKPQYPGIVVLFGGDLVSGDIHEELRDTNQSAGVGQAVLVSQWLVAAMRMLADAFKHVWIVCTYGNHARTTVKPRSKADAASNLDWLISQVVASHLRDDKRFTIAAPAAPDTMFSIYGTRFLLTHGDKLGVKGGDGIIGAIGPIIRGLKRIADSQATVGAPFDVLLMGHWHQYLPIGRAIVNGSIIGWNEYAKLQLRVAPEAPQQALFFVHPDYGVTNHWAVFAEPGHSRPYNAAHPVALQEYRPWQKS